MATLQEVKSQLSELAPFTKKNLQDLYGLSPNTVYKTIQSCGLSTAIEEYSLEEIEAKFHTARQLIAAGRDYKQVKAYFQQQNCEAPPEPSATGHTQATAQEGANTSKMAAFAVVNELAKADAAQAIKAYLPLFQLHLGKEFEGQTFQQQVKDTIALLAPTEDTTDSFLLQGLDSLGLLPPEMSQQALLMASSNASNSDIAPTYETEFAA